MLYHPSPTPNPLNLTVLQRLARIDWLGSFLLAAFVAPLLMGLIWGNAVRIYPSERLLVYIMSEAVSLLL